MASQDAKTSGEIFRKDHPMILAMNRHQAMIVSVRLAGTDGDLAAGTVLGRITSGGNSGKHRAYADVNSDGSQTAVGVLLEAVEMETASGTTDMGRMLAKGQVFKSKLVGLDAAAITDLGARTVTGADAVDVLVF